MGLSPALVGWCSALRQNLVKLRTCSEQCWEQKAGFEDASSCPTVCSSPGHMPSALSQAVWADMDLTLEPTSSKVLLHHFDHHTPCWVSITQHQETTAPHCKHFSLQEKACVQAIQIAHSVTSWSALNSSLLNFALEAVMDSTSTHEHLPCWSLCTRAVLWLQPIHDSACCNPLPWASFTCKPKSLQPKLVAVTSSESSAQLVNGNM